MKTVLTLKSFQVTTASNPLLGFSFSQTVVAPSVRPVANKFRPIQPKPTAESRLQPKQDPSKLQGPALQPEHEPKLASATKEPSQPEVQEPPVKPCSHCGDELKQLRQDLEQLQRNLTAVNLLVTETLIPLLKLKTQETGEKLRKNGKNIIFQQEVHFSKNYLQMQFLDLERPNQSENIGSKSIEQQISDMTTNEAQKVCYAIFFEKICLKILINIILCSGENFA